MAGATFNCAAPVNESPHNTGMTELPAVVQADTPDKQRRRTDN